MLQFFCLSTLLALTAGKSIDQQIVGGEVADVGEVPWQLSIRYNGGHICGAVALDNDIVLTAAHCVEFDVASAFQFVCGLHNVNDAGYVGTGTAITLHPNWDPNGLGFPNDIALVRVSPGFTFDDSCQPARLPPNNLKTYAGKDGLITGWGRLIGGGAVATLLKKASIPIITNSECGRDYNILGLSFIRSTNICVKDPNGNMGACNGDSGGPLTATDRDTGIVKVLGVTSFGRSGCDTNFASVYTRVSTYLSWIASASSYLHSL